MEKVENTAWNLGPDRAPGHTDGFPIFLHREFCSVIKDDGIDLVNGVSKGCARLGKINYSQIVLIPRKLAPSLSVITDLCPSLMFQ